MKNPNGFGTVTKLSGNRRKPWIAKVTIGYDQSTGKQIQKSLGTFSNRKDALMCLSNYHSSEEIKESFSFVTETHTFGDCINCIIERDKEHKSKSWLSTKKWVYSILSEIVDVDIKELNLNRLQLAFDNLKKQGKTQVTLEKCKVTCVQAFKYAIIHQWINRNDDFSRYINIETLNNQRKTIHYPFSNDEIKIIINKNDFFSKVIMTYILTGCRASELLDVSEIHNEYIVCGIKTENGKNRKIPIHPMIKPYIKEVLDYLKKFKYSNIQIRFNKYMNQLNMHHTMHDTRSTFATLAKESGIDHRTIKKLMGHSTKDLTEELYIKESLDYLIKQMNKISIN